MSETADTISSKEAGKRDSRENGWFNQATQELLPGIKITAGMTVVDVGCGGGQYSLFCAQNGAKVTFLDKQEAKVKALENHLKNVSAGSARGIQSDCSPIPLPKHYADLVICTEVLEHVSSPTSLVKELARIAKPGAIILLSAPDPRSEKLIQNLAPPSYFQEPNHIRIFSREDFLKLAENSGLEVERHESKGAFWAIFFLFKWATSLPDEGLVEDAHQITKTWASLWWEILDHPNGEKMVAALNDALPKSQFIVAHKKPE